MSSAANEISAQEARILKILLSSPLLPDDQSILRDLFHTLCIQLVESAAIPTHKQLQRVHRLLQALRLSRIEAQAQFVGSDGAVFQQVLDAKNQRTEKPLQPMNSLHYRERSLKELNMIQAATPPAFEQLAVARDGIQEFRAKRASAKKRESKLHERRKVNNAVKTGDVRKKAFSGMALAFRPKPKITSPPEISSHQSAVERSLGLQQRQEMTPAFTAPDSTPPSVSGLSAFPSSSSVGSEPSIILDVETRWQIHRSQEVGCEVAIQELFARAQDLLLWDNAPEFALSNMVQKLQSLHSKRNILFQHRRDSFIRESDYRQSSPERNALLAKTKAAAQSVLTAFNVHRQNYDEKLRAQNISKNNLSNHLPTSRSSMKPMQSTSFLDPRKPLLNVVRAFMQAPQLIVSDSKMEIYMEMTINHLESDVAAEKAKRRQQRRDMGEDVDSDEDLMADLFGADNCAMDEDMGMSVDENPSTEVPGGNSDADEGSVGDHESYTQILDAFDRMMVVANIKDYTYEL